jgi:ribosome maturation factor RimP
MSPTASPRLDRQKLRSLLEPVVGRTGAELEEVTEQRAGSRRLIRVVVDRDGGVSLDGVAEVTRAVSAALDDSDLLGEFPYVLEVTSPGVDRPLTSPPHWRRAHGRLVKAVLADGGEVIGRVAASDDGEVTLVVGDAERVLPYASIARARMQVEFNRGSAGDGDAEDSEDEGGDDDWADGGAQAPDRADES